jgi:hypothetical protein
MKFTVIQKITNVVPIKMCSVTLQFSVNKLQLILTEM